jgi:hypothetical protein
MRDNDPMTAAFDYGEARRVQLLMRRKWSSIACEETDEDHPACWRRTTDASDWCEACRRRFPIYLDWRKNKEKERKALRRLHGALQRAQEGR